MTLTYRELLQLIDAAVRSVSQNDSFPTFSNLLKTKKVRDAKLR
jgi:hypothetical protein